jgi:hypothetical protein
MNHWPLNSAKGPDMKPIGEIDMPRGDTFYLVPQFTYPASRDRARPVTRPGQL